MASLVPFLKKKLQQVEQGVAHIGAPARPVQVMSPQAQQALANPRFVQRGLQTPQQRQQFMQSSQQPKQSFAQGYGNLVKAEANAVNKVIIQPFITRPAAEVVTSLADVANRGKGNASFTPPKLLRPVFGDERIDSIQKKTIDQYKRQSTSSNQALRLASKPLAVAEAGLSVANDIPVVGSLLKAGTKGVEKVAPKALPALKATAKAVEGERVAANARVSTSGAAKSQVKKLNKEIADHQKQLSALPVDNYKAAEVLQRKIDSKTSQAQQIKAGAVKQPLVQKVTDKILTQQPGLSLKEVRTPDVPAKLPLPSQSDAALAAPGKTASTVPRLPDGRSLPNGKAESNFPLRLMEDERTDPILPTLEKNAYHDVKRNKDTLAATGAAIAKDEDKALSLAKRGTSTEANATALQLLEKYLGEGNTEKADDLVKTVLPRFTRQGQETQILAAYSKLSPVGAVKYANQQLDKAVAKSGRNIKLDAQTDKLHGDIQTVHKEASDTIATELKQGKLGNIASPKTSAIKALKTPEERLAARINASTGKTTKSDAITDMVNTLKKVADEVLPAKGKTTPRDPMQLIGQAIHDKANYAGVYDRAKALVIEKYKDNPAALEELDKYFTSNPERVYSKAKLNKGVQTGLKDVDLGKLVKEHYTKVDETGTELKQKLITQAGLSESEATQLAGDIQKRFGELTSARKDSILKQMFGERPTPEQKSQVQRILELSNLGGFSKDELRPAVGAKLGIPSLSKEATTKISSMADALQRLPENSPERLRAAAEMMNYIHKQVPSSLIDKALSTWTAGLLTGVKTVTGAPTSNAVTAAFQAPTAPIAAGLDAVRTLVTGAPRSNTVVSPLNYAKGFTQGLPHAGRFLKTGIDERSGISELGGSGETNFNHKLTGGAVNGVFRLMGALDRPFYYGQKAQSTAELNKLNRLNKGRDQFDVNAQSNTEARKSVLDFDTLLSDVATGIKQTVDKSDDPLSRTVGKVAAQANSPFVRVPTAGLSRMIDFSPAGAPVHAIRQAAKVKWGGQDKFSWRDMNTAIAESATGTGVVVLGAAMAAKNLVSGEYPSDQKEAKRWEAEGITSNSVKVFNPVKGKSEWVSANYLGPLGSLLQQGKRFQESQGKGDSKVASAGKAELGLGRDALNQSYLQGLSNAIDANKDPERNLGRYVKGLAGTAVPSISNDIANSFDKFQRQTNNGIDQIASRVPGLRNGLPIKQDVYGNKLEQRTGPLSQFGNPLRPSTALSNPVTSEVARLRNSDKNNTDLAVTPTPVGKSIKIDDANLKLNPKQQYSLQSAVGKATNDAWGKLIKTDDYKQLSDVDKANALNTLKKDAVGAAQRQYVVDNNIASYKKGPETRTAAFLEGSADISSYARTKNDNGSYGTTNVISKSIDDHSQKVLKQYNTLTADQRKSKAYNEPDYDYKVAQAKYDNNKANGKLSKAQQISAQDAVTKAKIGSKYSKDTRELYGLSKSEVYNLITSDTNGKKIASDLLAYGDALEVATGTKNKFRTSKGVESFATAAKGSGSSKFKVASIPRVKGSNFKVPKLKSSKIKQTAFKAPRRRTYAVKKITSNANLKLKVA